MKKHYYYFIGIAVIIYFVLFFILRAHLEFSDWITVSATLGGTFAAIITAIIALGIADKPARFVNFTIDMEVNVNTDVVTTYAIESWQEHARDYLRMIGITESINAFQVYFTIKNLSGFTLKRPVITFELPKKLRHPTGTIEQPGAGEIVPFTYDSNLLDVKSDIRHFEYKDKVVLSNNILPYLDKEQELKIWIRMRLSEDDQSRYPVIVSLSCDNAEGKTLTETIIPSRLLEGFDELNKERTG